MNDNDSNILLMLEFCKRYGFTQREAAQKLGYTLTAWRAYRKGQNIVKPHVLVGMKQFDTIKELTLKLKLLKKRRGID